MFLSVQSVLYYQQITLYTTNIISIWALDQKRNQKTS